MGGRAALAKTDATTGEAAPGEACSRSHPQAADLPSLRMVASQTSSSVTLLRSMGAVGEGHRAGKARTTLGVKLQPCSGPMIMAVGREMKRVSTFLVDEGEGVENISFLAKAAVKRCSRGRLQKGQLAGAGRRRRVELSDDRERGNERLTLKAFSLGWLALLDPVNEIIIVSERVVGVRG